MKKIFKELFELFVKSNKREPNAIEMLQLKFKASQKASQQVGKGEVIPFPPERITDWTKARPQPPEIEIIDGVQTTRGLGDLFERQMKNIGKKDPALYEDRGGNIIPAQFEDLSGELTSVPNRPGQSGLSYETKNKEAIQRLKDKMKKDPDDALPNYTETPGEYSRRNTPGSIENLREEMKIAYRNEFDRLTGNETAEELKEILKNLDTDGVPFAAGGVAGLLGERTGYAQGMDVVRKQKKEIPEEIKKKIFEMMMGTRNLGKVIENSERTKSRIGPEGVKAYGLAEGGRTGYNEGLTAKQLKRQETENLAAKVKEYIDIKGSGSISGKQDMYSTGEKSAIKLPEGVTSDESFINLIANLDIPISKKISLLGDVQYNKFRNKIQKGDEELFLQDPASSIDRKIGIGFDSDTGTTGSAKYDIDDKGFMFEIKKNFAEGGPTSTGLNYLLGEDDTNSRVSYGAGGRRGFLKLLAGLGAAGAAFKTGLLGLTKGGGKKVATEVAKEVATSGAPPPHFFKLVAKIKALGADQTPKYANQPRETVTRYKDFELTEHLDSGRTTVQRFKQSEADFYDEPLMEEVYMSHRPGEMTEGAGGKFIKTADEYTEDTSLMRTSGNQKGDVMDTVDGIPDDLLEELGETIVKKADGGRIGYAGGKKVVQGLISLLNKKAGKNVLTTADKLPIPKKTIDRDMFRQANNRLNKKRQLTDQEIQDYEMELGDSETWMSEGTVGEAENALKNQKAYQDEMYQQYKMGKLDPVAGDKSPARKRFLEKKLEEMLLSDDPKLMTKDEIEELTFFDMGTEIDQMRKSKPKSIIPKDEYAEYKNDFNKEILNMSPAEKKGKKLADSMSDAEIDLRDEFPGIEDRLIKQILTDDNPQRVAEVKQTMREALEMQNKGMSVDEIIQTFKGTTRTKQAEGGRMDLWLGGGLKAGKSLTREMLKFMSKGSTNAKSPKELLKLYNPKQFNRLLDNPLNTGKISPATGETADEMILDMINRTKEDRADMVGDLIGSARKIKKVDDDIIAYKNKIIKDMIEGGIDKETANSFANKIATDMKEEAAPQLTSYIPKITDQGLIELENIQKNLKTKGRKLNATGGLAHLLGE
jgi:hypothetical protein